jgi:hypothetical protein
MSAPHNNYAEYLPERRKMMQWWGNYLDRLWVDRKRNVVASAATRPHFAHGAEGNWHRSATRDAASH